LNQKAIVLVTICLKNIKKFFLVYFRYAIQSVANSVLCDAPIFQKVEQEQGSIVTQDAAVCLPCLLSFLKIGTASCLIEVGSS
jgi:hypothetical protein